ncbi:hypothetical protein CBL_21521 [Carabus blaptoides fortunei]
MATIDVASAPLDTSLALALGGILAKFRKCKHCGLRRVSGECDSCKNKIESGQMWPCKYEIRSCPVKLKWTELKQHEKTCEFARFPCANPYKCYRCISAD